MSERYRQQRIARRRAKRRGREQGFTLIELLVSMVAGLMVAMALVGVSKDATNTFFEESRTAAAETALRAAVDRLRSDINRASFMSTPNILQDPLVPLDPQSTTKFPGGAAAPTGLSSLQGLRIIVDGSVANTPLSAIAANGFSPDSIELSGNMTGVDSYSVTMPVTGTGCGGQAFLLQMDSTSMRRVRQAGSQALTVLQRLFQPVAGSQFLVRLTDEFGRMEFAPGCAAGTISDSADGFVVELASGYTIDVSRYGLISGRLSVNPVHTVRWEIRTASAASAGAAVAYGNLDDGTGVAKYDLLRRYLDTDGTAVGTPELIAEYAVDLKFAITADLSDYTLSPVTAAITNYAYGSATTGTLTQAVFGGGAAARPQRVRAVDFRLSTRSSLPDRSQSLTVATNAGYNLRYCTVAGGCTVGQRQWARVRTLTGEVTLMNQARGLF